MASGASGADKARLVREHAEKACRTEMETVPPEIPYTVVDLVGKGSFGSVFKGIHNETKQVYAIKSLDLDQQDEEIQDIQKEIGLLSQLKAGDAPNITAFYGTYVLGHKLWIIMDFCSGGSMRTLMKAGPIEEKYIGVVVRETLTALSYLHSQGIIHRDIKAANILVNQDGRIQLCDFGVSAQLAGKNNKRNTFVGTPQWMAPEALAGGLYDSKIDIWSFGITIYELAKQNPPLYQYHPERVVDMIPRMPPPRLEGGNWSNGLREFVALCLNEVPDQRPTAEELQRSKFVKSMKAPTAVMRELIVRYELWEKGGGVRASMLYAPGMGAPGDTVVSDPSDSAWDFDTVKSRASGVPKEFGALAAGGSQTLRGHLPPSGQSSSSPIQRGPRPRNGAEKLYRLFEDPSNEEPWNESEQEDQFQTVRAYAPDSHGPSTSVGMISIPSFDDNGMRMPEQNMISIPSFDDNGMRVSEPTAMISIPSFDDNGMRVPEPTVISIPSFNDNGMRVPGSQSARAPSPIGMISMPTEEEMMEMARQKAAASVAAAAAAAAAAAPPPPLTPAPPMEKPTITRTRPHRADSAEASLLQPVAIDSPLSPPQAITREPSRRIRIHIPASAPSSPPRFTNQQSGAITLGGLGGINGREARHLPSKSVPNFAGRRDDSIPPVPALQPPKVRSADSIPGPHLKSRSQDIGRSQDITVRPQRLGPRPSHLNLGASNGSNFDVGVRLVHPQKQALDVGSLEFPQMAPLDTTVLALPPGSEEMMRELDRVLMGLGDALEVVEVGLRRLHKERRQKMPADVEE